MDKWDEIRADYERAKKALHVGESESQRVDDESHRYYLWKAYHNASSADNVDDHLLYARILLSISRMYDWDTHYDKSRHYIILARDEFKKAIEAGQKPDEWELPLVRLFAELAEEEMQKEARPYEEHIKMINGYELLDGVDLADGYVVSLEYSKRTTRIKLDCNNAVVCFRFDGAFQIRLKDPLLDTNNKLFCYKTEKTKYLNFITNSFELQCDKVTVESVERVEDETPIVRMVPLLGRVMA